MSLLNFLSVLDLSYNNFYKRTPTGTQINTFNASAFAGCTLWASRNTNMPRDEKPTDGGVNYNQDEGDEFWRGFNPCMHLGLTFSFVGVLAFKLDHPWKHFCLLPFNSMKVRLSNVREGFLPLIMAALCLVLVVTVSAVRLRGKFKF